MMKLLGSLGSPYVRKVLITAERKGLAQDVQLVKTDSGAEADALRAKNPLNKIPILFLADGTEVFDSHVICEYLDTLRPSPRLISPDGPERLKTLTLAALADGMLDAAILIRYEARFRPENMWVQSWVDRQQAKIDASVDYLEKNLPVWGAHPDYGHITLACALGWLDDRQGGKWRASHPKLAAWQDKFAATVPSFGETKPPA